MSEILPPAVLRAAARIDARSVSTDPSPSTFRAQLGNNGDPDDVRAGVKRAPASLLVGAPAAPAAELLERLAGLDLSPEFLGSTRDEEGTGCSLAVLRGSTPPVVSPAPASFRAVAVIVAYNEADVIAATIDHLVGEGLGIYLVDNWSTDDTLDIAREAAGSQLVADERFPAGGPTGMFDLSEHLGRVERIAVDLEADWVVLNDADEFRTSPWPAVTLRDALHHVQARGCNAVNYTALNFALTADSLDDGRVDDRIRWFAPERVGDLRRLNTWRQPQTKRVDLASTGSHEVSFADRKVFPFNFLMRHYPIRSVEQGLRKINQDRLPRYPADERLQDWHGHYRPVHADDLVRSPTGLFHFDEHFDERFLLERLTGFEEKVNPTTLTIRAARALRRAGLLDAARKLKWRLTP